MTISDISVAMKSDDNRDIETVRNIDGGVEPRLMITKMVLENFKSYAGVKEIGPFHKCFSSVVGPNGSGKSNVIDAMLFVFGKRAKKLRLNKVSELIHQSSAVKEDPPQFARVSVHFQEIVDYGDGDDDYHVVPESQTVVTRIAKRDNTSTYKLNGKNSGFKEVATYLNGKGIDLDNNRFLILQGEVELISMMPPRGKTENDEGLLEYLEDIIGSSKFVEATNQAAEKVETLTETRQEKLNRVKAVEKEKENLEAAKQEAESLLAKETEIRRNQNILFHIRAMTVQKELSLLANARDTLTTALGAEREAIVATDKRVDEIETGLSDKRKDYQITFEELKRTKEEFTAFERKDIKLREEIKHERTHKAKLTEKMTAECMKQNDAIGKLEVATSRIPKLELRISELLCLKDTEEAVLETIDDETKVDTQKVRRSLEIKTAELAPVKLLRTELQAALETAETELSILVDSKSRVTQRLESAVSELACIDETKLETLTQISLTETEMHEIKKLLATLEKEDSELSIGESTLDMRLRDLGSEIEDAQLALRSSGGRGKSKAVHGILSASKAGGELSNIGVIGRLGDLATIPEKYDVAISTACGGMLDNIVVQTTGGAQRCLDFLRKYDLGRASFIPLDKQKKGAHDRAVETPEGAPRLFDLIAPVNFAVIPALFLAVGNTLVASDMNAATRWAYESSKRWRVVTLDGNLIETTGTMSGGGKTARSGGMRLANTRGASQDPPNLDEDLAGRLANLTQEASTINQTLQQCRKRRSDISSEIRCQSKVLRGLDITISKLRLEMEACETTRHELSRLIPILQEECSTKIDDINTRKHLEEKVRTCTRALQECVAQLDVLETEVTLLQNDILSAGGPRLVKQRTLCADILKRLKTTEKELSTAKVEIASAEKARTKSSSAKKDLEGKLRSCESTIAAKEAAFKALEAGVLEVMTAYEQAKTVELQKRGSLDSVSTELEHLKKSRTEIRCKEVELLGQLEAIDKQISESTKKLKHWDNEISSLRKLEDGSEFIEESTLSGDCGEEEEESLPSLKFLGALPPEILEKHNPDKIKETIAVLQSERNLLAKNTNMGAIAEYRKKEKDYFLRVAELDEVTEERNRARKEHDELRRQRLEMFMDGFAVITLKLKEMYQMITLGGDAELELVDSLDPFSEGIVFSVRPPKKSWKNISNLSGGEKTLSSLSLVFALHHYKPTPLYVMDEIDAALDFKNVSIVANYIKERTKNAQFIIISLRNNMFELADRLVGIYKTSDCTKSVTINPRAFGMSTCPNKALAEKTNHVSTLGPKNGTTRSSVLTQVSSGD